MGAAQNGPRRIYQVVVVAPVRARVQPQPFPQPQLQRVQPVWLAVESSSHSVAGGKSGSEKNSSHTESANSSQGGMGQKP